MKALRISLLGLVLAAGLVSGADAHEPRIGLSVQLGYPGYFVAPPVYYAPPPVVLPAYGYPEGYAPYYYGYGPGWYGYRHGYRHEHRHGHRHRD